MSWTYFVPIIVKQGFVYFKLIQSVLVKLKPNKLSRKYGNWYTFLKNERFFVYTEFASYGKYIAKITVPKKCYC